MSVDADQKRAEVIDGKALAQERQTALKKRIAALQAKGTTVQLVAVSVGEDPAWAAYLRGQRRSCENVGITHRSDVLDADASYEDLSSHIEKLNADPSVHGILIQSPLAPHLRLDAIQAQLSPEKDVEGVHPANLGLVLAGREGIAPCTAVAAYELAKYAVGGDLRGQECCVIGASTIVGKPLAQLLLNDGATPHICHIDTRDVAEHTRRADIVLVAVGRHGILDASMLKSGAVVIDVGINRIKDDEGKGKTVGDASEDVWNVASKVSPVPGGVGSMTSTILLEATVRAAERLADRAPSLDSLTILQALGIDSSVIPPEIADRLALLLDRHLVSVPGQRVETRLEKLFRRDYFIMDGAVRSEIQKLITVQSKQLLEQYNISEPDIVRQVHQSYLDAGAKTLTTNTHAANRYKCESSQEAQELMRAGVRLARQTAHGHAVVLAAIGPLGPVLHYELADAEAENAFAELALVAEESGADAILLETFVNTDELILACKAIRSVCTLPLIVSRQIEYGQNADLAAFISAVKSLDVAAVGINCVSGLHVISEIISQLNTALSIPVFVRPNAGLPRQSEDGNDSYHLETEYYVRRSRELLAAGARCVGGCCGIGPQHIKALVNSLDQSAISLDEITATRKHIEELQSQNSVEALSKPIKNAFPYDKQFPVVALLNGRLDQRLLQEASTALCGAGANALGLIATWQQDRNSDQQAARDRWLQDVHQVPALLEMLAGDCSIREAESILRNAHILGVRNIIVDSGVFAKQGLTSDHAENRYGKADTLALLRLINALNDGLDCEGRHLSEACAFRFGIRVSADTIANVSSFEEFYPDFITLQPIYEPKRFRELMASYTSSIPLWADILVLSDANTADAIDNELPALSVPSTLRELLRSNVSQDAENVIRFLQAWQDRLSGVCLLLPDERTDVAVRVISSIRELH